MPDGVPVIAHHGTPGSRLLYRRWVEDAAERGIRLIAYDRPGYGGSDRHAGRAVADVAADVEAIADALGLDRILARAAPAAARTRSPARPCSAIGWRPRQRSASSPPTTPRDSTSWPGWGRTTWRSSGPRWRGRRRSRRCWRRTPYLLDADPGELTEGLNSLLSPPDVAVVNGGLAEELIAVTSEGIRARREGWLDDDLAFVKPWGFDLATISVPSSYGRAART